MLPGSGTVPEQKPELVLVITSEQFGHFTWLEEISRQIKFK